MCMAQSDVLRQLPEPMTLFKVGNYIYMTK